MKTLTSMIVVAALAATSAANAKSFSTTDDSFWSNLCYAAATNDNSSMTKLINRSHYSGHFVAQAATCNGKNIIDFASKHQATATHKQLVRFKAN